MKHGTYSSYTNGACRCDDCKQAARAYWRERSRCIRGAEVDQKAFGDLLHELCPDGLTTAEERALHESLAIRKVIDALHSSPVDITVRVERVENPEA